MPMSVQDAEAALRADGRFEWLLSGRRAWSVGDVTAAYAEATGVPVSHDTVTRWFKALGDEGGAERYPGLIGWRAQTDALVIFFAMRRHLRQSSESERESERGGEGGSGSDSGDGGQQIG